MIDIDKGWTIVCGVLIVVGLFNLGLILSVLRNRGRKAPFLSGSLSEMLNPWKQEDDDLALLHDEVSRIVGTRENDQIKAEDG